LVIMEAVDNIHVEQVVKYDMPLQTPVIYRGSESRGEVAKHFVASV